MIYHGDAAHLLADPLVSQVDFKADPNAWDKVHLALLSPDMQRQYLVNRISSGEYYFFTGQLLIDLGRPQAIEAISAKLAEMDSNPEDYNSKGYSNLLIVLYVCGDHYQSPIWSHLKHPPENPIGNPWGERNQLHEDY